MIRVAEKMVIREKGEQHMQPAVHWCLCESANKDLSVSEVCGCPKLAVVLFCFFWLRGGEPGTHRTTIGFVQNGNKNTLFICHHTWGTVEAFPVLENVIS
jgi:hypothetical protein